MKRNSIWSKILVCLLSAMASTVVYAKAQSGLNPQNIVTFTNNSYYTLTLKRGRVNKAAGFCIGVNSQKSPCRKLLTSGQSQRFYLTKRSRIRLAYIINADRVYTYRLNLKRVNGKVRFSATTLRTARTQLKNNQHLALVNKKTFNLMPTQYKILPYRGIALSGSEAHTRSRPEWVPSFVNAIYFIKKGMNTFRLPVRWSYITKNPGDTKVAYPVYMQTIKALVKQLLEAHTYVVISIYAHMRFSKGALIDDGKIINQQDLAKIWTILGKQFSSLAKKYPKHLIFNIMDEPYGMKTKALVKYTNTAIKTIRGLGIKNLLFVDVDNWSGLHYWFRKGSSLDNTLVSEAFIPANIHDPLNNYAFSVVQYFDENYSGTHPSCQALSQIKKRIQLPKLFSWIRKYKVKFILKEFGPTTERNCVIDNNYLLNQITQFPYTPQTGGFIGWIAWAGGHGGTIDEINNMSPYSDGTDRGQIRKVFAKHLTPPTRNTNNT